MAVEKGCLEKLADGIDLGGKRNGE